MSSVFAKKKKISSYTTEVISIITSGIAQTAQAVVRRNLNLLLKEIWRVHMKKHSYRNCQN